MLNRIEQKLTALIGDDLATRAHLSVVEAPRRSTALNPGEGVVVVSLSGMMPSPRFERDARSFSGTRSRRVMPVGFSARIDFFMRPDGNGAVQLADARNLMLEDMSLVCHGLARQDVSDGRAFAVAVPDPGFRVRGFAVETADIERDTVAQGLSGSILCRGTAEIWPPGVLQDEGEILGVDTTIASLPVAVSVGSAVVRAGQTAELRVRSLPASRMASVEPFATQPLQLAVTVAGDAPPAQRGTIAGGTAGAETGFRIIDVTPPETVITYHAPAGGIGATRIEYVAIHLATPDLHRGVFLGSTAIRLEPA